MGGEQVIGPYARNPVVAGPLHDRAAEGLVRHVQQDAHREICGAEMIGGGVCPHGLPVLAERLSR